jgi:hypothetical protein
MMSRVRCNGVMQAAYRLSGDLLECFDAWERVHPEKKQAYYESPRFISDLLTFMEARYPGDPCLAAMAWFCRAALEDFEQPAAEPPEVPAEPALALCDGVRLVTTRGDVNAILRSLRAGLRPEPAVLDRWVTVVIVPAPINRSQILHFPEVTLDILRHALNRSTILEIVGDFEKRGVAVGKYTPPQIVAAAVDMLAEKDLIRVILPEDPALQASSSVKPRTRKRSEESSGNTADAVPAARRSASNSPFQILDNAAPR